MLKLQWLIKMLIFCPVPDAGALFCKSVVYYWITQKKTENQGNGMATTVARTLCITYQQDLEPY